MTESHGAEAAIEAAHAAGDFERAATLTLERYGSEVLGFLVFRLPSREAASDVFSQFAEDFWRSLETFEWRCSMRTWVYKLARRSALKHLKEAQRERRHRVPDLSTSRLAEVADRVRTTTLMYMRTDVKDRFVSLREKLPPQDQTILVLRVDRGLPWLALAEIMWSEDVEPTGDELKREAARLRKRFESTKHRLKLLASEQGLLPDRA